MAKRGRPLQGTRRGSPLTIYVTEPRETLFERAFELMRERGFFPSTAEMSSSRTVIIDHALDALIRDLKRHE